MKRLNSPEIVGTNGQLHMQVVSMIHAIGILAVILFIVGLYPSPLCFLAESVGSALNNFGRYVSAIVGTFVPQ